MNRYDVIIIGYGPTGKVLARQLLDQGHKVAVVERWPAAYPLPRAIGLDHEVRRILNALGYGDEIARISRPLGHYAWFNADWEMLLDLDQSLDSISGGPIGYTIDQPELERVFERDLDRRTELDAFLSHEALWVRAVDGGHEVAIAPFDEASKQIDHARKRTITGRYLIGCDGANSLVREAMDVEIFDHGFDEPWLVVDVRPHDMSRLKIPESAQWCNPERPTTIMPGGIHNRRWEFMLKAGETPEAISRDDVVWELLSPWMKPEDGELIRRATYRFRSRLVRGWRKGRMILAGDAAHLMPPFMGQGLCAGVRDAWNLGWKLDRVLKGTSPDTLLDAFEAERSPHVDAIIRLSMELGRVICVQDPEAARARDAAFLSGKVPAPPPFPSLTGGLIARDAAGDPLGCAGVLLPHDILERGGEAVRFDDVTGRNFALITREPVDAPSLHKLGVRQIVLGQGGWRDVDGRISRFLDANGAAAVLARPDFYAFGSVQRLGDLQILSDQIEQQLAGAPCDALA